MKDYWLVKLFTISMDFLKKIFQVIRDYQIAPIISGGLAILFLKDVIFSKDLDQIKTQWAIGSLLILFICSVLLYYFLRKLEKDRDTYLISSVGKIVEDIFKHYGVAVGSGNSPGSVDAKKMNLIMQTTVNHLKEMVKLSDKKYRD